jgi:3'-5' exoribonuclease
MKIEKVLFVSDLTKGKDVVIPLLVQSCVPATTRTGSKYLNLVLSDKSGLIDGKVWNDADIFAKKLSEASVFIFHAEVTEFQQKLQLKVKGATAVDPAEYDESDFRQSSPNSPELMRQSLMRLIDSIEDPDYRELVLRCVNHQSASRFWGGRAAKSFHHAYEYGLLEHTLSVASLADMTADHYDPLLNKSLLLAGAILHDVGKVWEFTSDFPADYTTTGRLLTHLFLGPRFVSETAAEIPGFPTLKLTLLLHLLLSHHGDAEKGSPVTPMLLEAVVLHELDNMDGKLMGISQFMNSEKINSSSKEEDWTSYNNLLRSFFMRTPKFDKDKKISPDQGKEPEKTNPAFSKGSSPNTGGDPYDSFDPLDSYDPFDPPDLSLIPTGKSSGKVPEKSPGKAPAKAPKLPSPPEDFPEDLFMGPPDSPDIHRLSAPEDPYEPPDFPESSVSPDSEGEPHFQFPSDYESYLTSNPGELAPWQNDFPPDPDRVSPDPDMVFSVPDRVSPDPDMVFSIPDGVSPDHSETPPAPTDARPGASAGPGESSFREPAAPEPVPEPAKVPPPAPEPEIKSEGPKEEVGRLFEDEIPTPGKLF